MMLKVTVKFLDRVYHGRRRDGSPEWPPSPFRLFQAMVAASNADQRLKELEKCQPPIIIAPSYTANDTLTVFQQSNNQDKKAANYRRELTQIVPHSDTVEYIWPDYDGPDISDIVSRITHVGHGIDIVVCFSSQSTRFDIPDNAVYPSLKGGHGGLYVPKIGTLDRLVDNYNRRSRVVGNIFNNVVDSYQYCQINQPKYAAFSLRDINGKLKSFDSQLAGRVGAWLRHAALERIGSFPGSSSEAEVYVAGHVPKNATSPVPRFHYMPLPSIGHEHSDGCIRKVLISEPRNGSGRYAEWAQTLLNQVLTDTTNNQPSQVAVLSEVENDDKILKYYVGSSKRWSSVTPVILSSNDRGDPSRTESLTTKVLIDAGLDLSTISAVKISRFPLLKCILRRWNMENLGGHLHNKTFVYLDITFKSPMHGPLALGAGRFTGLGVMAREMA